MKLKYILTEISSKNKENKELPLLGVNKDKEFMPSIANIIGTDLKTYKLVKKGEFCCNLQHVDRDELVPISLLESYDEALVSPSYNVFRVNEEIEVDKDYLFLSFKRKEFDRNAWYLSGSSIRGNLTVDSFLEIDIPLPSLEKQIELINEYKIIQNRILVKEAINNNLSEQFMLIFNNWYDELKRNNDTNGILGDVIKLRGESISKKALNINDYYLPIECLPKKSLSVLNYFKCDIAESSLTRFCKNDILLGAMRVYFHRVCIAPFDGVTRTTCFVLTPTKTFYKSFAVALCNSTETIQFAEASSKGSTMPYAVWEDKLEKMPIYIPNDKDIENFNNLVEPILNILRDYIFEYNDLVKLKETIVQSISKQ